VLRRSVAFWTAGFPALLLGLIYSFTIFASLCADITSARADILDVLKQNKLVIWITGYTFCKKGQSCADYKKSTIEEFRLTNDLIYRIEQPHKTGVIYPVRGELDVLKHPEMVDYLRTFGSKVANFITSGQLSRDELTLRQKFTTVDKNFRTTHTKEIRIRATENGCSGSIAETYADFEIKSRATCEIVSLTSGHDAKTSLVFRGLQGDRLNVAFSEFKGRHYFEIRACEGEKIGVEFNLEGGSLQGKHECGSWTIIYSSKVERVGDHVSMTASGHLSSPPQRLPLQFDIRFSLKGASCELERLAISLPGGSAIASNASSACAFE
jgi:hypothetical protein